MLGPPDRLIIIAIHLKRHSESTVASPYYDCRNRRDRCTLGKGSSYASRPASSTLATPLSPSPRSGRSSAYT